MTDTKSDPPAHPPGHLPGGTGTGPAGGEPIKPTTPARDPAAEAAALAAFEAQEERLAEVDLPPAASAATAATEPRIELAPGASGKMVPLGPALPNPPVVVFDKVTKT